MNDILRHILEFVFSDIDEEVTLIIVLIVIRLIIVLIVIRIIIKKYKQSKLNKQKIIDILNKYNHK